MKVFKHISHSFDNPTATINNNEDSVIENGNGESNNDRIPDAVVNGVCIYNADKNSKISSSTMT